MLLLQNEEEFRFDKSRLENIAKKLSDKDIELIIINNKEMRELNAKSRGIDKSTDVLSFPLEDIPHAPLGSIVINIDKVIDASSKLGHSIEEELSLLFIHGLLHLLGYDHESDDGQMRKKEEEMIKAFNLPKSLILRVEN